MAKPPPSKLTVETYKHDEPTRENIPTTEDQSAMQKDEQSPTGLAYESRNLDFRYLESME